MQISDEGKIGIALALIGIGGGGALFVLPHPHADYVGWSLIGISVVGLILLGIHHYKVRVGSLFRLREGWKRMWPQYLMTIAGILFFIGLIGFLQINVKTLTTIPNKDEKPSSAQASTIPSLFSFFMNDNMPAKGMRWNAFTDYELYDSAVKIRIFYTIYDDFSANAKYISIYVPGIFVKEKELPPAQTIFIAEHFATHYREFMNDIQGKRWAEFHTSGISDFDSTKSIPFSGRIYFYHVDSLSIDQQSDLGKLFRANGADVRFIGLDYAVAAQSQIQLGKAKMPPQYKFENNMPVQLPN